MSMVSATINGSEIVTKGNYHTLATRTLTDGGLVLDGENIEIGNDDSTVVIKGHVTLPEGVGMSVQIVDDISQVTQKGVIYLIPSQKPGEKDIYDEYMLITDPTTGTTHVEKIGSTALTVAQTFDPTSAEPLSGVALNFLSKETLTLLQSDAYVQEAANTSGEGAGAESYLDERIRSVLGNGRIIDMQVVTSSAPTVTLVEGSILYSELSSTTFDMSNVACWRNATAEIWLAVPSTLSSNPQITWPRSADPAVTTWLEGSQPSSLTRGNLYGIVIRNDGLAGGPDHYVMNLAYQYSLSDRG